MQMTQASLACRGHTRVVLHVLLANLCDHSMRVAYAQECKAGLDDLAGMGPSVCSVRARRASASAAATTAAKNLPPASAAPAAGAAARRSPSSLSPKPCFAARRRERARDAPDEDLPSLCVDDEGFGVLERPAEGGPARASGAANAVDPPLSAWCVPQLPALLLESASTRHDTSKWAVARYVCRSQALQCTTGGRAHCPIPHAAHEFMVTCCIKRHERHGRHHDRQTAMRWFSHLRQLYHVEQL